MRRSAARVALAALAALLLAAPLRAQEGCEGVPEGACAALRTAVQLREEQRFEESLRAFEALRADHPRSFPIQYGYGRLLAQMRRYSEAARQFEEAAKLGPESAGFDSVVYNTLGFVLLMDTRYEEALVWFRKLERLEDFPRQPEQLRTKVYNNSGVAYLQLDRYQEAKVQFEKAKALGSELAEKNLAKIASILATLESGDVEVPGAFAVIVASARKVETVASELSRVAAKLAVPPSELRVYLASNGRYLVARASNVSYPKAEQLVEESRKKGIADAFIGSTTEWEDVSAKFYTAKN